MTREIAIIAPGALPVPAVKGGAIETLITGLIDTNENKRLLDITVFSSYDKTAFLEARKFQNAHFIWIHYSIVNKIVNVWTRFFSKITNRKIPHYGVLQMIRNLKKGRYDAVLIEGNDELIIPVSKCVGKQKTYFHLHARLFSTPNVYDYCCKVITVSNYIRNQVLLNTKKSDDDVVVLKNCTNISKFSKENNIQFRQSIRSKFNITPDEVVMCFTGRIVKVKGVKEFIEALLMLPDKPLFKAFIIGSAGSDFGMSKGATDYYSELLVLAKELNDRVIFTGFVDNAEIPKFLAASDISVIPSLYEEPGALTIFESLAAGLPIVTTDAGGTPEYVTDDCAFVIKRGEIFISNLSTALKELIISQEKRELMGNAGFRHVQQFTYDNYYADMSGILIHPQGF